MKIHPALLMVLTWGGAFALFFILPFNLVGRTMTLYGLMVQALFIGAFCAGALLASRPFPQARHDPGVKIDWRSADRILMLTTSIAILVFLIDLEGKNIFDLASAYSERSDRATALLNGAASDSTIWFQIGFLLYPSSYVYLVREIGFQPRPKLWRMGVFGVLPSLLAALSMGGRAGLLFTIIYAVVGYLVRQHVFPPAPRRKAPAALRHAQSLHRNQSPPATPGAPPVLRPRPAPRRKGALKLGMGSKLTLGVLASLSMVYFIQVFVTRAEGGGGIEAIFGRIGLNWGISFDGRFSNLYYALFGVEGTYLIFVFAWYAIQGIVMSNAIFTDYEGPMLLGTYGIDLASAVMRRVNGDFVGDGFAHLLNINVYGFLPSSFGSLYIDLKFFGLIPCLIWGWLAGFVYRKIRSGADPRYLLLSPFIVVGILFSLNNTPIGLSNGLMLHFWLLLAFFMARTVRTGPAGRPDQPNDVRRRDAGKSLAVRGNAHPGRNQV